MTTKQHSIETARLWLWMVVSGLIVANAIAWSEASRWPEPLPPTPETSTCWPGGVPGSETWR